MILGLGQRKHSFSHSISVVPIVSDLLGLFNLSRDNPAHLMLVCLWPETMAHRIDGERFLKVSPLPSTEWRRRLKQKTQKLQLKSSLFIRFSVRIFSFFSIGIIIWNKAEKAFCQDKENEGLAFVCMIYFRTVMTLLWELDVKLWNIWSPS